MSTSRLRGPVLALDLGATNARAAIVSATGELSHRHASAAPVGTSTVVDHCIDLLATAREEHLVAGGRPPVAVGICAPGPLDATAGMLIDPPNMRGDWHDFPLASTIGDRLGLPWVMERDTNVAILAERDRGAGQGSGDLVYLTISTGVGGAVISDGRLLRGPDGVAGELGHMTIDIDGPLCGCGGIGHLEAVASGTAIARSAHEALDDGQHAPQLSRLAAARAPARLSAVDVSVAEGLGDPVARVILERARQAVALAVVSIVNVFDPDVVILGGGITLAWGERLLAPAREAVKASAFRVQAARAKVVQAALGDDVGLLGMVPLVASALPELVIDADHQDVSSTDAAVRTS